MMLNLLKSRRCYLVKMAVEVSLSVIVPVVMNRVSSTSVVTAGYARVVARIILINGPVP